MALGATPHPGVADEELVGRLWDGYRMRRPYLAGPGFDALMRRCWLERPEDRPDFGAIVYDLGSLVMEAGGDVAEPFDEDTAGTSGRGEREDRAARIASQALRERGVVGANGGYGRREMIGDLTRIVQKQREGNLRAQKREDAARAKQHIRLQMRLAARKARGHPEEDVSAGELGADDLWGDDGSVSDGSVGGDARRGRRSVLRDYARIVQHERQALERAELLANDQRTKQQIAIQQRRAARRQRRAEEVARAPEAASVEEAARANSGDAQPVTLGDILGCAGDVWGDDGAADGVAAPVAQAPRSASSVTRGIMADGHAQEARAREAQFQYRQDMKRRLREKRRAAGQDAEATEAGRVVRGFADQEAARHEQEAEERRKREMALRGRLRRRDDERAVTDIVAGNVWADDNSDGQPDA